MILEDLIALISTNKTVLLLFFLILPVLTFFITLISSGRSLKQPFSYMYSIVIFIACLPGFLSLTLWGYSIIFEEKSLVDLPFFIYYLPIIIMMICLHLVTKKEIAIKNLPWSGELYEMLLLVVITFASLLIVIELDLIYFRNFWKMGVFFAIGFYVFRWAWLQLKEINL